MIGEDSDCARSLRSREAVALRTAMLRDPHIARFTCFVAKLEKAHPDWEFPNFDRSMAAQKPICFSCSRSLGE
ncbi:hypothetical protein IVB18_21255 [Bradyrhizobium sp. 186]|uniref:hypothetical protein n=1 Tax=Bradyrhizobium sp. 186 TaxID=2782654 RepID=UPI002001519B|nr:hypothetical protein [Bradyrhizobium sp. 186]UPK39523.1 hypothetical protein IVB18_21255 [Bradyrhizobium sp. 186]